MDERLFNALAALIKTNEPGLDADKAVNALTFGDDPARMTALPLKVLSGHMDTRTAELIRQLPQLSRAVLRSRLPASPVLRHFDDAAALLYSRFSGLIYEQCRLLSLDARGKVINDTAMQKGSVSSVPFYINNIVEQVLTDECAAVIIGHDHPGGTAAPSQADIDSTSGLIKALSAIRVPLLDHIIIAGDNAVSIRETGAIAEQIWLSQPNECSALMKLWSI